MAVDRELEAAIAANRFGLGARPGEIAAARSDPRGWLKAQIRRQGADQPAYPDGRPLPTIRECLVLYADDRKAEKVIRQAEAARHGGAPEAPARGRGRRQMQPGADAAVPAGMQPADAAQQPQAMQGMQGMARRGPGDDAAAALKAALAVADKPVHDLLLAEMLGRTQVGTRSPQSFRERWTLFWANHFTVALKNGQMAPQVGPFEREAIRPHVFGRFQDLLVASSLHPAMLFYLDQNLSAGPNSQAGQRRKLGLNENLAREIMELHTLGTDGGYTQADVTEFARALTGRSVLPVSGQEGGQSVFRDVLHEPGPRKIMGKTYPEGGEEQAMAVLVDLAANPATGRHCARQIAAHFVADTPPPALVARLEAAWRASGGDLSTVAAALIDSPEAWSAAPAKFKTPNELLVSAYRAVGSDPQDSVKEVNAPLIQLGQRPYTAPQPNGWSDATGDWAAPDAMIKRVAWAKTFGSRFAPPGAPQDVGRSALGTRLADKTVASMGRAESRPEAIALLLMSPEFQRR